MSKYTTVMGVSPTASGAKKAADIVAALAPPSSKSTAMVAAGGSSLVGEAKKMAPGLAGAGVGYFAWKKHPVLGILAGHAVGSNAMELATGDRKKALCNLAVEGAGIYGALKYGKGRTGRSVLGYVAGAVAGAVATYFVPGSPARDAYDKWRK